MAECNLQRHIAGSFLAELFSVQRIGLHIDAVPAVIVECPSNRQGGRIVGTDVDVKPTMHVVQGTPQENILARLRVRYDRLLRIFET